MLFKMQVFVMSETRDKYIWKQLTRNMGLKFESIADLATKKIFVIFL